MDSEKFIKACTLSLLIDEGKSHAKAGFCIVKASLPRLKAQVDCFLHPTEKQYFFTLAYPKRQQSYLLGRFSAKHAIATLTNCQDFSSISIENGVFQHPIVQAPNHPNIQISITHTGSLGASLAFSETIPMAIDIEEMCLNKIATIQSQVREEEKCWISLFPGQKIQFLTFLWTAKEALSKVLKCGLMISLDLLELATVEREGVFIRSTFKHFYQYQVISFPLSIGMCSIVYPKNVRLQEGSLREFSAI